MKQVVVIGGGAAGLMAAIAAADSGAKVTLIEKNEKIGKKIYITGKGRCNLTNACPTTDFFQNVPTNGKFLYSAVNAFDSEDTCRFFEAAGLRLKVERGNRVFPVSDKSSDVIKALQKECDRAGVKILLNTEVLSVRATDNMTERTLTLPKEIVADAVIVATGGLSYPSTGSTGDGYRIAENFGHSLIAQIPSLVPILLKEPYVAQLEGLSLRNIAVKIVKDADAKPVFEDFGELLFTDRGVSGPVILTATGQVGRLLSETSNETVGKQIKAGKNEMPYKLFIDLKPALDEKQLDQRILRDFEQIKNKEFKNSLQKLLPAKMVPVVVALCGIAPETRVNQISKVQRAQLVKTIKQLTFTIDRQDSFDKAVITKGGICVKEINPKTMESKLAPNLYFAGEVLDVDALTGGFNLQIAFSSGRAAGLAAAERAAAFADVTENQKRYLVTYRKK